MPKKKEEKGTKDVSAEQIGFHKGALSTLSKERQELAKMLQIVEQLMKMHIKALKDLGIDIEKLVADSKKKKPLEDELK